MAFSVNYGRTQIRQPKPSAPVSLSRFLVTSAILFGLFSIYDYSSYGQGYVAVGLTAAQHWFQEFMGRFRVRI